MLVGLVERLRPRRCDHGPESDLRCCARWYSHAAAKTEDRIEYCSDSIRRAAVRRLPRPAANRCRARAQGNARDRFRIGDRRLTRLRQPPDARPRPVNRQVERSRRVASRAPASEHRTRSARTSWRRPDARRRPRRAPTPISAYEVSSISRARVPRFEIDTRRTSASSSGETATSSVVVIVPSWRTISARSSENSTS